MKKVVAATEITHQSAGFAYQQYACRDVPGVETDFPETIEAASSYISQVQGR